jgi:CheY-like chemotaxis protein
MNKGQTILLVDDSENDMVLMRAAFEKAGFDIGIQEVHNGAEAISYFKGEGVYSDRQKYGLPSVVLLDLNMPLKNGFEVIAWVRSQPAFTGLPIVVMTSSMRPEDVKKAFELGASSYLVKPINIDELAAMVSCLRQWIRINHFPPLNEMVGR